MVEEAGDIRVLRMGELGLGEALEMNEGDCTGGSEEDEGRA